MAGVMVATDEPTFNRLSIQTVEDIIREVGLTTEESLERARQSHPRTGRGTYRPNGPA